MSWVIFVLFDFNLLVENENLICFFFIYSVMAIFNRSELFIMKIIFNYECFVLF